MPGRVVAVGRLDGMVELWAWQEGARLAAFPAHQGFVAAALFLRAGCQLLTAGEDGKVRLPRAGGGVRGGGSKWKYLCEGGAFVEESRGAWLESYMERAVGVCTEALQMNFWREDFNSGEEGGLSLSPFLGPQVQVWSGSLGRPRGCLGSPHLSPALSVALSPDGDQVAVGYRADGIWIYRISSGTEGRRAGVFEPGKKPPPLSLPNSSPLCKRLILLSLIL